MTKDAPPGVQPDPAAPPPCPAALSEPVRTAVYLDSVRAERRALAVAAVAAIAAIVWIAMPVGVGILLGTLLGFSLQPLYERVVARTRRPRSAALGGVLACAVGLLAITGGLSSLFIARGLVLVDSLSGALSPGGALRSYAQRFSTRLGPFELQPVEISAKLHDAAAGLAAGVAGIAATVATTTFDLVLALVFALMTLSYILPRWPALALRAEDMLPLRPRYTRALLEEFQRVGRITLLGTVVTGIAQGALAALGYWLTGVPEAAFFGAATAVASLVPGVGTLLVWVPAGLFLIGTGHPALGILELCWGALVVVGVSDYILRPRLVGGDGTMPPLLTFVALFGGVQVFGLSGLILGPLVMSVSFAVLRIFAQESEERRALGQRHA